MIITVTMTSNACPDKDNTSSSACYVIKHITNGDDTTATYGGKIYKNCSIDSMTIKYGENNCSDSTFSNVDNLAWASGGGHWYHWGLGYKNTTSCSVIINCGL